MATSAAEDDAATEALIAQLIAEDLDVNIDSLRVGASVEDYEDPLSSYERGLLEDPDHVTHGDDSCTWGDSGTFPNEDVSPTKTVIGKHTVEGEGWDMEVAKGVDEQPHTATSDHGDEAKEEEQEQNTKYHLSDEVYLRSDAETNGLTQTVSVPGQIPCQPVKEPRRNISDSETNVTNIPPLSIRPDSSPRTQYIGYVVPGPVETGLPPRFPTPLDPRRNISDPSGLETIPCSATTSPTIAGPGSVYIESTTEPLDTSQPLISASAISPALNPRAAPTTLTDEEATGAAIISPQPARRNSVGKPVEWRAPGLMPGLSAFDRYDGLDIDYSSSKGKGKARAFDSFGPDEDDYDAEYELFLKENLRKNLGVDADGWDEGEDSCSPWIYIPFPGTCGGEYGEFDQRTEDDAVVEIRVAEDETVDSILRDMCNAKSKAAADEASTVGTDSIRTVTSTQPSSVQGEYDEESTSKPDKRPKIRTLRQERRKARHRKAMRWDEKPNDPELLCQVDVRRDCEGLKGLPKQKEKVDEEVHRAKPVKRKAKKNYKDALRQGEEGVSSRGD